MDLPPAQSTNSPRWPGPSISGRQMLDTFLEEGLLDESQMVSLLGAERHDASIDKVEMAVITKNALSLNDVLALKARLSGKPVLTDGAVEALPILPKAVAKATGALALDLPSPTIAIIEDLPENLERIAIALRRDDFAVWLLTAPQFLDLYRAAYSDTKSDLRPPTRDIFEVFDECIRLDASDIHLSVGAPPILRLAGALQPQHRQPLDQKWMRDNVELLLGPKALERALDRWDHDAGYSYGDVRFRINVGADVKGLTLAIRRLPSKIPSFDDLGLPAAVRKFASLERGLVLVTGPTGSGKSTTLASLLSHIGLNQPRHMLTLEDPIEFTLPARQSLIQQRELGSSFSSFADGLRQSLRQDPDVVLVGEARDRETIGAAVTAAETGALVFASLHTYDAASTLGRIISVYPEGEQEQIRNQLAYVLKGVVSQTLVPAISGGRIAAFEVLVSTPAVVNNLRKPDGLLQIKQTLATGQSHGMQTMEAHLAQLAKRGVVTVGDAEYKARDLDEFRRQLDTAMGEGL